MKVHNIRRGFATNSSSVHSFIIMDKPSGDKGRRTKSRRNDCGK